LRVKGTITGGVNSPDYAENIGVNDASIEAADVVTMDPSDTETAIKASTPYDSRVLGVISTSPGFVTNATSADDTSAADQRPLALSGRVPVKVSTMNGTIHQGDYLTSSTIPGVAMKATGSGAVIGVAMEDFDGSQAGSYACASYTCGKVQLFINPSATNPAGDMGIMQGGSAVLSTLTIDGAANFQAINISGNATFSADVTIAGTLKVADIIVGGHVITSGVAPTTALNAAFNTAGVAVTIEGNDTTGTITLTASATQTLFNDPNWPTTVDMTDGVSLVTIDFNKQFSGKPRVILSAANAAAAKLGGFTGGESNDSFQLYANNMLTAGKTYTFTYWIAQ
jgi:hypothetical protein